MHFTINDIYNEVLFMLVDSENNIEVVFWDIETDHEQLLSFSKN